MMTNRWINYLLSVVVVLGLVAVTLHERPRLAEERAELLDQEVVQAEGAPEDPGDRDALELRPDTSTAPDQDETDETDEVDDEAEVEGSEPLGDHGVSASHPVAVEVGMEVLDAGGNAVDAAIAVGYALGVAEPFGSGPGGGGAMLVHGAGEDPVAYDYRETAPLSGELPAADIGTPGFVLGMEHVHERHATIALPDLIEPAARLAEDGVEVSDYLHARVREAGPRLPIHLVPSLFPGGEAIASGEMLRQPEYASALRRIQSEGSEVVYGGELGQEMAGSVSGLELEDLEEYQVLELEPAMGEFADYDIVSGAAPVAGPTLVQTLQIAEGLGIADMDLASADAHHAVAQAWRLADDQRRELVADPTMESVDLDTMLSREHTDGLADEVPADRFVEVAQDEDPVSTETDTTHVVIVDDEGTMVSMTNTLSNFFGSGLPVSGFFLNDQLKNFAADPESVNHHAPGKRPRSFITPTILARDGDPLLGIGSPGGRRIPMMTAQVLIRAAAHGQPVDQATAAPRFHLEGETLEVEEMPSNDVVEDLTGRGYEVVSEVPTSEYFGGMQALMVDREAGAVSGVADDRRVGAWDAASR